MNVSGTEPRQRPGQVLTEGWRLAVAGAFNVFPCVLAAEIIGSLPVAGAGGGLFSTDLERLAQPAFLGWTLLSVFMQSFLYAYALLRLAQLDGVTVKQPLQAALSAIPGLLSGYIAYELLVVCGLGIALIFFLLVMLLFGLVPALVVAMAPLAATAWISTALAFFAYPAVLEQSGPFVALGRSLRLAKSSWAHAALVVSVPAIGLLLVAVLQDAPSISDSVHSILGGMSQLSSQPTAMQLQNMLSGSDAHPAGDQHPLWHAITVLLSAVAWWYAVTVCYAEFKMLKRTSAVTAR